MCEVAEKVVEGMISFESRSGMMKILLKDSPRKLPMNWTSKSEYESTR